MKPLYIFDLDGTLALIDHRRHFVADKKNQRWDEFYRACVDDLPNKPIIEILQQLGTSDIPCYSRPDTYIFSGRSDLVRDITETWLELHLIFCEMLKMRVHGDFTPDDILKKQWYDELSQEDKDRLVCVFDDRQKVVDMWRSIGVTCLQVAPGDF